MMPNEAATWRKVVRWVLLVFVLAGLGQYIVTHLADFEVIIRISPNLLVTITLMQVLLLFVAAWRHRVTAERLGLRIGFWAWLDLFVYSRFLNRFYPQAGNAYRATVLKMTFRFPLSRYVGAFALFHCLDTLITLLLLLLLLLLGESDLQVAGLNAAAVVGSLVAGSVVVLALVSLFWRKTRSARKTSSRFFARLAEVADDVAKGIRRPRLLLKLSLSGLIVFAGGVYMNWLCFVELGSPVGSARLGVLHFVRRATLMISLTPGNVGITETCYGLLSGAMGDAVAHAIIVAAVMNITGLAAVALLWVLLVVFKGVRNRISLV